LMGNYLEPFLGGKGGATLLRYPAHGKTYHSDMAMRIVPTLRLNCCCGV
jgi:hypothetical protein